jgi:hypothetical protein
MVKMVSFTTINVSVDTLAPSVKLAILASSNSATLSVSVKFVRISLLTLTTHLAELECLTVLMSALKVLIPSKLTLTAKMLSMLKLLA